MNSPCKSKELHLFFKMPVLTRSQKRALMISDSNHHDWNNESDIEDDTNDESESETDNDDDCDNENQSRGLPPCIVIPLNTIYTTNHKRKKELDSDDDSDDEELMSDSEGASDEASDEEDEQATVKISENTICPLKKRATKKMKRFYDKDDNKYYKALDSDTKTKIDNIEAEISTINQVNVPLRFRILNSDMNMLLKSVAINKLNQLSCMESYSEEYFKLHTWIESLCKLPIGKYKPLPINTESTIDDISAFLDHIKTHLDSKVHGHSHVKDQIIRLLAKWVANKDSKGMVIGLEGPPGVGKTSIAMEICQALGLPFGFLSLAGISTSEILKGFQYTYQGSTWGSIADILMKAGVMNPILFFDELDKVSTTRSGEEITNTLIHLTDHSQNHKFSDRYFADIDLDLSKCLMIFSYNDESAINPILRDRMVKIKTDGYNMKDKINIAKNFMLPKIFTEFSFASEDLIFKDDIINYIVNITEEEEGVRNLKRSLEEVVSQVNLYRLLKKPIIMKNKVELRVELPMDITRDVVDVFISKNEKKNAVSLNMMYL